MSPVSGLIDAATYRVAAIVRMAVGWIIVGVFVVVGAAFGAAAGWQALALRYDALTATWAMAAGCFIVAVFFAIILSVRSSARRRRQLEMRAAADQAQTAHLAPLLLSAFTTALAAGRAVRR